MPRQTSFIIFLVEKKEEILHKIILLGRDDF